MKLPKVATVDFETDKIQARPEYPPKPAGVSIRLPGERKSTHYACGYPSENNCSREEMDRRIQDVWLRARRGQFNVLFQNAKFDCAVAEKFCGVEPLPALAVEDTMFLLFLDDPHARSHSLKPSADRILGMAPTEADELKDWIVRNVPGATKAKWGADIAKAPGKLVGKYADGDVDRTLALWKKLRIDIDDRGMSSAYQREQKLMPILLRNEAEGARVDMKRLAVDVPLYTRAFQQIEEYLRKALKAPGLDFDKKEHLANALDAAGVVTEWSVTKKSKKRSTSKKDLTPDVFHNMKIYYALSYRQKLATCIRTFMFPWFEIGKRTNGWVYTSWNQIKGDQNGGDAAGARSGRMSSSNPLNFQNIPKKFEKKDRFYKHPDFLKTLPPLPLMRTYLIPDSSNEYWMKRDFAQQELRYIAHLESGELMMKYLQNPNFDLHEEVHAIILEAIGIDFERDLIKGFNFQDLYGGGVPAYCSALQCDAATAKAVKEAKRAGLQDFAELEKEIRALAKGGGATRSWGGRQYYAQPAGYSEKYQRHMEYSYKQLNYVVQPSAADITKEVMIRYDQHPKRESRLILAVHDELDTSTPKKRMPEEQQILRECMQSIEIDVPMTSDGEYGDTWGTMQKYKDPEMKYEVFRKLPKECYQ